MTYTLDGALDLQFQVRNDSGVQGQPLRDYITDNEPCAFLFMPGAFTPTCQGHICDLAQELKKLAGKVNKAAQIIVVTSNDCDVNKAWQQVAGDKKLSVTVLNDTELKLTKYCQLFFPPHVKNTFVPPPERGLGSGERPCRFAMVFDENLNVVENGLMYKLKCDGSGNAVIDNGTTDGTKPEDILKKLQALQKPVAAADAPPAAK